MLRKFIVLSFVSKVAVFTKFLSRFVPNGCLFLLSKAFLRLCFLNQEVPIRSPPLSFFLFSDIFIKNMQFMYICIRLKHFTI